MIAEQPTEVKREETQATVPPPDGNSEHEGICGVHLLPQAPDYGNIPFTPYMDNTAIRNKLGNIGGNGRAIGSHRISTEKIFRASRTTSTFQHTRQKASPAA
uniref:Uncharacterized protein n=1 Tax=Haemonchus contortus TaxID=6289 RepID=W6NRW8_HAECO